MRIILGIDPGSRLTGFGVILSNGSVYQYIGSGCIRTQDGEFSARLVQIYQGVKAIVQKYQPREAAVEQVFMHKHANAALKLGHARGAAIIAIAEHIPVIAEYAPRQIKQAIVGYGGAEKTQVQQMVQHLLNLSALPQADAADALAVAICHANSQKYEDFLK